MRIKKFSFFSDLQLIAIIKWNIIGEISKSKCFWRNFSNSKLIWTEHLNDIKYEKNGGKIKFECLRFDAINISISCNIFM